MTDETPVAPEATPAVETPCEECVAPIEPTPEVIAQ
jgi:hypothetical protein